MLHIVRQYKAVCRLNKLTLCSYLQMFSLQGQILLESISVFYPYLTLLDRTC